MSEDTPEYHVSNRQRRLRDAVSDLPEPFPTTRDRGDSEPMRHLPALRYRLDVMVKLEDAKGEEQNNLHRHRAERNALIWALQQLAPAVGVTPVVKATPKRHSPEYVASTFEECQHHIAHGYTVIDPGRPGVLLHKAGEEFAPVEVSLTVWFYVRGLSHLESESEAAIRRG